MGNLNDFGMKIDITSGNSLYEEIMNDTLHQLKLAEDFYKSSHDFYNFINNPTVSLEEKLGLVDNAFLGKVSANVLKMLKTLVKKGEFHRISDIKQEFGVVYERHSRVIKVTVISSKELTQSQYNKIATKISEATDSKVRIVKTIDKTLIGGVIIEYDGKRLDGSLKAKLDKLHSIAD